MVNSTEFADKFREEAQKNMERAQAMVDAFVVNPADPPMALTHREIIWKRGKTRLYRYHSLETPVAHPSPYLIVPWLGISRPYVLDLMPGASMIEYLVDHGHDVYLLDWGEIAEEDKELGFEEAAFKILPRAIDRAMETSGATEMYVERPLPRRHHQRLLPGAQPGRAGAELSSPWWPPSTSRKEGCSAPG